MAVDRRHTDLDVERRIATLEANRASDILRMLENHNANQASIAALEKQVSLSNAKMDVMLEAVHMAKGGWWAAGKIIGLVLGVLSGLSMIVTGIWWAYQHLSFKPAVTVAIVTISAYFAGP